MKLLHELGIIFGDVSSKNVAFSLGAKPRSMLVDTDSARRKGTRGAFGAHRKPRCGNLPRRLRKRQLDYFKRLGTGSASELGRLADAWTRQTVETDVYKFGLMVVRVLDYGRRSTQNRRPDKARQVLRSTVSGAAARLLDRTLRRSEGTPDDGRLVSDAPRPDRVIRPLPAEQAVRYRHAPRRPSRTLQRGLAPAGNSSPARLGQEVTGSDERTRDTDSAGKTMSDFFKMYVDASTALIKGAAKVA